MKARKFASLLFITLIALFSLSILSAQTSEVAVDVATYPTADTTIAFDGTAINVTGDGAAVNGSIVTITAAGTYELSGTLSDGQVVVDTDDTELVTLILNGVNMSSSTSAPIYIKEAQAVAVLLADGTQNSLSDAATYVYENAEDDEPNAALFSDDDMTIYGGGNLIVTANYNDGITSKDSLTILASNIIVTAVDDGIRGKDYLVIDSANLTLDVQGDGLKSDNEDDTTLGYIDIVSGMFNIVAGGDAITAQSQLHIADGTFNIVTGGGSNGFLSDTVSTKGLKSAIALVIDGGTFNINSADDGVHANESIVISGGTLTIATGDDGVHADASLEINGGTIDITQSYEGLESAIITINDGNIHLVASDDGLNVAGGNDDSGFGGGPGGAFAAIGDYYATINGGYLYMEADGDGLDANGSLTINGGTIIVNGPTMNGNGPTDVDGTFSINGGELVAFGSSGMLRGADTTSTQTSFTVAFANTVAAGTLVHVEDSAGNTVLAFVPTKSIQALIFSSANLNVGETYTIYQGGTATGTVTDGLYNETTASGGSSITSITLSTVSTVIGGDTTGGRGGGRR